MMQVKHLKKIYPYLEKRNDPPWKIFGAARE
jgi:hypothetical protein